MAIHSSILAWRILWTEEHGGLQSIGSQRVGHDWNVLACTHRSMRDISFPGGTSFQEPTCQCRRHKRDGFDTWVGKIPWRRAWQPIWVFLPGESHIQRRLAGYSPQSCKELDITGDVAWTGHRVYQRELGKELRRVFLRSKQTSNTSLKYYPCKVVKNVLNKTVKKFMSQSTGPNNGAISQLPVEPNS